MYKLFLDEEMLSVWKPLLDCFVETEIAYEKTIDYTTHPSSTNSTFCGTVYWTDLQNGVDLVEKYGSNTAPFIVSYTLKSWLQNTHYIGTYSHGADYSSDEVQNNALSYFETKLEEVNYIEKGSTILLPSAIYKEDSKVNFLGWQLDDGSIIKGAFKVDNATTLKAVFGANVHLNPNDNEINPCSSGYVALPT
jgi:hypothetical protein